VELVVPEISSATLVLTTIELFDLGKERHPDFDMPILCRPINQSKKITFNAKVYLVHLPVA
jgi:hypothetical protein